MLRLLLALLCALPLLHAGEVDPTGGDPVALALSAFDAAVAAAPDPSATLLEALHAALADPDGPLPLQSDPEIAVDDPVIDWFTGLAARCAAIDGGNPNDEADRLRRRALWRCSPQGTGEGLPPLDEISGDAAIPVPPGTSEPLRLAAWPLPVISAEGLYETAFRDGWRFPLGRPASTARQGERCRLDAPGLWWLEAASDRVLVARLVHRAELRLLVAAGGRDEVAAWIVDGQGVPCPGVAVVGSLRLCDRSRASRWYQGAEDGEGRRSEAATPPERILDPPGRWPGREQALAEVRVTGISDGLGVVRFPLRAPDGVGAVAWQLAAWDGRRSGLAHGDAPLAEQEAAWQAWIIPARPLYLPGETVEIAVVLRGARGGADLPVEGEVIELRLGGPDAEPHRLTCDRFGLASARIALPGDARPGRWALRVSRPDRAEVAHPPIAVQVEQARTPPLDLVLEADRPRYLSGDRALLNVTTRAFHGAPLATAGILDLPQASIPFRTGADGTARITVDAALLPPTARMRRQTPISVTVSDATNRPVQAEVEATIDHPAGGDGTVCEAPPRWIARGREVVLAVRSFPGGRPAIGDVRVTLTRFDGERWIHQRSDGVALDQGCGVWRWIPDRAGRYHIACGSTGHECTVVAAAEGDPLRLRCEPARPQPGQEAWLHIAGPAQAEGMLWIGDGGGAGELRGFRLDGDGAARVRLAVARRHAPGLRVLAASLAGGHLASAALAIATAEPDPRLQVTLSCDPAPRPGGTSQVTVRVADPQGRPVAAAVVLAAVDAALLRLRPDQAGDGIAALRPLPRQADQGWWAPPAAADPAILLRPHLYEVAAGDWVLDRRTIGGIGGSRVGGGRRRAAGGEEADDGGPDPTLRRDLRFTAGWYPALRTGDDGSCRVEVSWPDQLTTWRLTARALDAGRRSGSGQREIAATRTVTLDADLPRLLRRGDRVRIQALVGSEVARTLRVSAEAEGADLAGEAQVLEVPAGGRVAASWILTGTADAGTARIRLRAAAVAGDDDAGDGLELPLSCLPAEGEVGAAWTGRAGDGAAITLPAWASRGSATLAVSRGPAGALDAALDTLVRYPYGCTEQTVSRFLPAAAVLDRVPGATPEREVLRSQLPDLVASGVRRLAALRTGEGHWGWWAGSSGDLRLTAWVRFAGAELAARGREAGGLGDDAGILAGLDPAQFEALLPAPADADAAADLRAQWRESVRMDGAEDVDAVLLLLLAEARAGRAHRELLAAPLASHARLDAGQRAVLALALHAAGDAAAAEGLAEALDAAGAADAPPAAQGWLGDPAVQAAALCLAGLRCAPQRALADRAAGWLMALRRDGGWGSTHATAWACLALGEHAALRPAAAGAAEWILRADGRELLRGEVEGDGATVALPAEALRARDLTIEGRGLWYDLRLRAHADLPAAGHALRLERRLLRVVPGGLGEETLTALGADGLRCGEQVAVELVIESALELEQVLVEVPLPAGLSPLLRESGPFAPWGRLELRADRTAVIVDRLPAGTSRIRYRCLAEMAGEVAWPAATAVAMYRPDLCARTAPLRLAILPPEPALAAPSALHVDLGTIDRLRKSVVEACAAAAGDDDRRRALFALAERLQVLGWVLPEDPAAWPLPDGLDRLRTWILHWRADGDPQALLAQAARLGCGEDFLIDCLAESWMRDRSLERFHEFADQPPALRRALARRVHLYDWLLPSRRAALFAALDAERDPAVRLALLDGFDQIGGSDHAVPADALAWIARLRVSASAAERWRLLRSGRALRGLPRHRSAADGGDAQVVTALLDALAAEPAARVRQRLLDACLAGPIPSAVLLPALPRLPATMRPRLAAAAQPCPPELVPALLAALAAEPDAAVRRRLVALLRPRALADAEGLRAALAREADDAVQAALIASAAQGRDDLDAIIAAHAATAGPAAALAALRRLGTAAICERLAGHAEGALLAEALDWGLDQGDLRTRPAAWWERVLPRLATTETLPWRLRSHLAALPAEVLPALERLRDAASHPDLRAVCLQRLLAGPPDPAWAELPGGRIDAETLRVAGGRPAAGLRRWIAGERHHALRAVALGCFARRGDADDARWLLELAATWPWHDPAALALLVQRLPADERLARARSSAGWLAALLLADLPSDPDTTTVAVRLLRSGDHRLAQGLFVRLAEADGALLWRSAAAEGEGALLALLALTRAGPLPALAAAHPSPWVRAAVAPPPWSGEEGRIAALAAGDAQARATALVSRDPAQRAAAAAAIHRAERRRVVYEDASGALVRFVP